ncbi:hypothetical protein QE152_g29596 [Popillia japonica]|uniref:Uncharacterized protein n=1 Tax=Popillia japonica TaxID=7064 RepID=A0AAW1JIE6_POPJA
MLTLARLTGNSLECLLLLQPAARTAPPGKVPGRGVPKAKGAAPVSLSAALTDDVDVVVYGEDAVSMMPIYISDDDDDGLRKSRPANWREICLSMLL